MVKCYGLHYLEGKLIWVSRSVRISGEINFKLYHQTGPSANMKSHESETIERTAMEDLHDAADQAAKI
jgi:hypothetical protein